MGANGDVRGIVEIVQMPNCRSISYRYLIKENGGQIKRKSGLYGIFPTKCGSFNLLIDSVPMLYQQGERVEFKEGAEMIRQMVKTAAHLYAANNNLAIRDLTKPI